jgi:hypothetical protein
MENSAGFGKEGSGEILDEYVQRIPSGMRTKKGRTISGPALSFDNRIGF